MPEGGRLRPLQRSVNMRYQVVAQRIGWKACMLHAIAPSDTRHDIGVVPHGGMHQAQRIAPLGMLAGNGVRVQTMMAVCSRHDGNMQSMRDESGGERAATCHNAWGSASRSCHIDLRAILVPLAVVVLGRGVA